MERSIQKLDDRYRKAVIDNVVTEWGGPLVTTMGELYDTSNLPGFVAIADGKMLGYILLRSLGDKMEVAVLQSVESGRGVGRALMDRAIETAKKSGCKRIWLVTTNDNTSAIRFYQKYGFELVTVNINAMEAGRKLKPSIPLTGDDDIPIKHEFVFEMVL